MASPARSQRRVDPIICWPGVNGGLLSDSIAEMQRLNPSLGLRCAVDTWTPDYAKLSESAAAAMRRDLEDEETVSEYLIYAGTANDVVTIVMPEPISDEDMSSFSDLNRESGPYKTDLGKFQTGPRRIERTADGNLLIRPRSQGVEDINGRFAMTYQGARLAKNERQPIDQIVRFQARWGIFRERHEVWEVDFAYHEPGYLDKTDDDGEYWRTTPIGTISFIDRYDLPISEHLARAQAIVAAGSKFAVVVDVETAEGRVFRASGAERFTEAFRLQEWSWFDVPVRL